MFKNAKSWRTKKKIRATYPAQLRTGQNAHNCWKINVLKLWRKYQLNKIIMCHHTIPLMKNHDKNNFSFHWWKIMTKMIFHESHCKTMTFKNWAWLVDTIRLWTAEPWVDSSQRHLSTVQMYKLLPKNTKYEGPGPSAVQDVRGTPAKGLHMTLAKTLKVLTYDSLNIYEV